MGAQSRRSCRNSSASSKTRRSRPPPPASSPVAALTRSWPSPTRSIVKASWDGGEVGTGRRDVAMMRKMEALRRLVPRDGTGDEVDEILLRAAGYIARLQAQVRVMQLMVDVLEAAQD